MPLTYKDVALVNTSLNQLGDSLLQDRMMRMRAQENAAQDVARQAGLGLERERLGLLKGQQGAELQHWKNIESKQDEANRIANARQDMLMQAGLVEMAINMNNAGMDTDAINVWMDKQPAFKGSNLKFVKPTGPAPPPSHSTIPDALAQADYWDQRARKPGLDPGDAALYKENAQWLRDLARLTKESLSQPPKGPTPMRETRTFEGGKLKSRSVTGTSEQLDSLAGETGAGAEVKAGEVAMINPKGERVAAPLARVAELKKKGYRRARPGD